jgi:hypothetical protein
VANPVPANSIILAGGAVGLETLTGLRFLPHRPFTGCCICGAVFQSEADRFPSDVFEANPRQFDFDPSHVTLYALGMRKEWSLQHAKTHPEREHLALQASGQWATPEAVHRLVAYGVVNLGDSLINDEHEDALRESSPIPVNDVEGT